MSRAYVGPGVLILALACLALQREEPDGLVKCVNAPDEVNTFIKAEGFLPVTKSGVQQFSSDSKLKVYINTLPNTHLTPTDDPTFDKVKLAVQQNIGAAVAPNGNPQQVLDDLQKQAESGS